MIYIGIDNGLQGALAAIGDTGEIISVIPMPTTGKKSGNEIIPEDIVVWLQDIQELVSPDLTLVIEVPGKFSPGRMALTSMWDSFGSLRTIAATQKLRYHRVPPQRWQAKMLPGCAAGDTKPAALARVKQLWPRYEVPLLKEKGKSVKHHGVPDALLIAEYARLERL
jgi:hypothetical protein